MSEERILFLDIDGVLNSEAWYRSRSDGTWSEEREFDPEAVFLLRAIVALTGCDIVISSSWRIGRNLAELQNLLPGLPLIDKTPVMTTGHTRGEEIKVWLQNHAPAARYAIVDDDSDFYETQPLVKTCWKTGLLPRHAQRIVEILQ